MNNNNSKTIILNHNLELYIPNKDAFNQPIDVDQVIQEISEQISDSIGGLQKWNTDSVWGKTNEKTKLIRFSFSDDQLPEVIAILLNYAISLAITLKQAEIAVMVDGKLILTPTEIANLSLMPGLP